jgi:hypothetical protein
MGLSSKHFVFLVCLFLAPIVCAEEPPIVPLIDPPMRIQLRKIYRTGLSFGNRPAVFAKVGDSITGNKFFLKDVGCGVEVLGSNQSLAPTIKYFRGIAFPDSYTTAWCGNANSFSRDSYASDHGWTANEPLKRFANPTSECPPPDDNPLRCELRLLKPSIALIMFGTNDLELNDPVKFRKKLTQIVQETIVKGVVPVLSTIPPRLDNPDMGSRVAPYNMIIREIAETLQVPLWNYWISLQHAINQGMDHKGIHPNVFDVDDPAIFTSEALRYGFNLRNFTAIQVLQKIKAVTQNRAPADASALPNFAIFPVEPLAPVARGTTVTFKIKIVRNHFSDSIHFSIKGRPSGVSAAFTAGAGGTFEFVTLTVRPDAVPGDYRITIHGTSGKLTRTTTLALTIPR